MPFVSKPGHPRVVIGDGVDGLDENLTRFLGVADSILGEEESVERLPVFRVVPSESLYCRQRLYGPAPSDLHPLGVKQGPEIRLTSRQGALGVVDGFFEIPELQVAEGKKSVGVGLVDSVWVR